MERYCDGLSMKEASAINRSRRQRRHRGLLSNQTQDVERDTEHDRLSCTELIGQGACYHRGWANGSRWGYGGILPPTKHWMHRHLVYWLRWWPNSKMKALQGMAWDVESSGHETRLDGEASSRLVAARMVHSPSHWLPKLYHLRVFHPHRTASEHSFST